MTSDRWLGLGALGLLVASLFLPAIDGAGFPALSGMDILRQGAGVIRDGIASWYANPMILAALGAIALRRFKVALALALFATLLALSSFAAGTLAEHAGRSVPAFGFSIGFYLWLLAFLLTDIAATLGIYKESKRR